MHNEMIRRMAFAIASCYVLSLGTTFAEGFPKFPMSVFGTLTDWSREVPSGATITFTDWSWSLLGSYVTTSASKFGGNTPADVNPTFQEFSGALGMSVSFSWKTFRITEGNIDDAHAWDGCPEKSSITFASGICRYDLNLSMTVESLTGAINATGSVDFPTSSGSVEFEGSGTVLVSDSTASGNTVTFSVFSGTTLSSSWTWDGVFRAPEAVASSGSISLPGYVRIPELTFEIGSETASLTLSWTEAEVKIYAGISRNWKILKVYRSSDKQSGFQYLVDCTVSSWWCVFRTSRFSTFALLEPASSGWSSSGGSSGGSSGWSSGGSSGWSSSGWSSSSSSSGTPSSPVPSSSGASAVSGTGLANQSSATPSPVPKKVPPRIVLKFTDIANSWAKDFVEKLATRKIVNNSLQFRPDDAITRAELLKIALNASGKTIPKATETIFSDVEEEWQKDIVNHAKELGIISGQSIEGKLVFRPNDPITRAEAAKILASVLWIEPVESANDFSDVSPKSSLAWYVQALKDRKIFEGQSIEGKLVFRPNDPITRAEVAKTVVKSFGF